MANDVPALLQLVESLGKIYAATRSHASNSHARKELRSAVSKLSMALETPEDIIERTTYMPLNTVLIRIAIDLKIFKLMVEKERPLTLKELADMTGADYALLQRIMRSPAAVKVLEEVDVETYLPNIIATTFAGEKGAVNSKCFFDCMEYGWHKLPEFLAEAKFQTPAAPKYCAINKGLNFDEPVSAWIFKHPGYLADKHRSSARIHYFHNIYHNWPDDQSCVILRHTRKAMKKGYSKLLINEFVISSRGASAFMTHIDINMMSILVAMERTEKQWRTLLESAGLKVVKIRTTEEDSECNIETMLA